MRRILLIAICSIALVASSSAAVRITWNWSGLYNERIYTRLGALAFSNDNFGPASSYTRSGLDQFDFSVSPAQLVYRRFEVRVRWTNNVYYTFFAINANTAATNNVWSGMITNGEAISIAPNGTMYRTNETVYVPDPVETNSVSWTFDPLWLGVTFEYRATNGTTLHSGVVSQAGVYSFEVATNASLLNGAQFYIDGINVGTLATDGTRWWEDPETGEHRVFRPGISFEADTSWSGTQYQIRGNNDSVLDSGTLPPPGTVLNDRTTIAGTNGATVWTYVSGGDGIFAWVPSPVVLTSNNVTTYTFVNNPGQPAPTPFPTPAPLSSPTPAPTPPAYTTNGSNTVVTNTNEITVTVDPVDLEDPDDGEEDVVNGIGELSTLVTGIVQDMRSAQTNFVAAGALFSNLRLSGVGKNCTFQFGPSSITLQTSDSVRAGLKLLILGIGAFAAASMIRGAVQS